MTAELLLVALVAFLIGFFSGGYVAIISLAKLRQWAREMEKKS